ncbi:hypothetical protein Dimus_032997 [Dionaea muscipula]
MRDGESQSQRRQRPGSGRQGVERELKVKMEIRDSVDCLAACWASGLGCSGPASRVTGSLGQGRTGDKSWGDLVARKDSSRTSERYRLWMIKACYLD